MALDRPVFVVGTPRSGTTLMSAFLSANEELAVMPETHFLRRYGGSRGSKREVWQEYAESDRFGYLGVDRDAVQRRLETGEGTGARTVFESILVEYARSHRKDRVGEKTPAHYRHIDTLLEWFPDGRVVWMIRDPRAVVASLLRTPWGRRFHSDLHAISWRRGSRAYLARRKDPRILGVGFEDLVRSTEEILRRVAAHVEIGFTPEMIAGRSDRSSPIINREGWAADHLRKALGPVKEDPLDRWRDELARPDVRAVEHLCRAELPNLGYDQESVPFSMIERIGRWMERNRSRLATRMELLLRSSSPELE